MTEDHEVEPGRRGIRINAEGGDIDRGDQDDVAMRWVAWRRCCSEVVRQAGVIR